MNKAELFWNWFDELTKDETIPSDVQEYIDILRAQQDTQADKPALTESGIQILEYLQGLPEAKNLKAKDIADGMNESSRKISGSMRKLVSDGFVDKFGQNPVVYTLTEKGKNFDLTTIKEN